jgi:hypothetical protein
MTANSIIKEETKISNQWCIEFENLFLNNKKDYERV